jgi:ABC-2 type transport system permease protein
MTESATGMRPRGHRFHWLRAVPTLLRVGVAETVAYRAEFLVWMLTNTLPLIMLGLWTAVAAEGPFAHYGERDFIAYYLAILIVRTLTGSWVVWQMNEDIRHGTLSMQLLRPIHPFVVYVTSHLAAVPLRALIVLPVAAILLISSAGPLLTRDPAILAMLLPALAGAWALAFFVLVAIGTLAFFLERSIGLTQVYFGVFSILSGYLLPLDLLPGWLRTFAEVTPFRFMLAFPVELLMGAHTPARALVLLAVQWAYAALVFSLALALWHRGIRRYEAYGS